MPIKVTLRPDTRYFVLRDIDGTERGRYSIRLPKEGHMGQGPSDVALKIASRTTGTKDKPIEIRLRELGTDRVRLYQVWTELAPFAMTANPLWKSNRTHYLKRFSKFMGEELLDGSPLPSRETTGIFLLYHKRLQDKYDELKAAGKLPETFEKDWQEWISDKIQDTHTTDLVGRLFVQRSVGGRPRGKH